MQHVRTQHCLSTYFYLICLEYLLLQAKACLTYVWLYLGNPKQLGVDFYHRMGSQGEIEVERLEGNRKDECGLQTLIHVIIP